MRVMTENFVFYKEAHFSLLLKQETVYGPNINIHSIAILLEILWDYWSCG
jgi:hypothetical protein